MMGAGKIIDLSGKTALVTGAAAGIGKASAKILAEAGASVALLDINYDAASRSAVDISASCGVPAKAYRCDVLSESDSMAAVEEAAKDFGTINILVNNTGGGGGGRERFDGLTGEYIDKIFSLNVYSIFRFSRFCLPYMKSSGYGSIVNISSMASVMSSVNMSVYSASKAAVNALTRQMAIDVAPVRVNAVAPGAIKTDALATVLTDEMEEKMLSSTPLKRLGVPEDIASAVLFFASPMSSWVSGQTLIVSGGGTQVLE
ncbi:glucose 1-dehydrogenase [Cloacibacillus evryensis]|uniref:glucose 1-dehydrogenase n=1 Tax=Cloacibacillus evryensis TaxID=508460 RepID=UPI003A84C2BC